MNDDEIKARAFDVKRRFRAGEITFEEAEAALLDYADLYNRKSAKAAKKHGVRVRKFNAGYFLRIKV